MFWHHLNLNNRNPSFRGGESTIGTHTIDVRFPELRRDGEDGPLVSYVGERDLYREANLLDEGIARRWGKENVPHAAPNVVPPSEEHARLYRCAWSAETDTVTRDRLAHFLRTGRLDTRFIPGALGKAVDILKVTAGLDSASVVKERWEDLPKEPYIEWAPFSEAARPPFLSAHGRKDIRRSIFGNYLYIHQPEYRHNGVTSIHEPAVEGDVVSYRYNMRFKYISVGSLRRLFANDTPSNLAPRFVAEYLNSLDESQLHTL